MNQPTRDQLFYRADGDCIFQVEDHLFKIHKYHLLSDPQSEFFQIFAEAQVSDLGNRDAAPIVLNATCTQFRAFLIHAYDDPLQHMLQFQSPHPSYLRSKVDMGLFCHDYNMATGKEFAVLFIAHVCRIYRINLQPSSLYRDMLTLISCQPGLVECRDEARYIRSSVHAASIEDAMEKGRGRTGQKI
ncbi:hypothetical protein C8R43DRAFT_964492 [Mycena crocata]|nr:hypothetical protein C8R43DRAFT_964492 [Mycena crocata]